jgi:TatD DNase family protein
MNPSMPRPPPLIDVDCNLWHPDLKTLQRPPKATTVTTTNDGNIDDGADNENTTKTKDSTDVWNILIEDAIEEANIVAMVSPSSTLQESIQGLHQLNTCPIPIPNFVVKTTVGIHPYHVNDIESTGTNSDADSGPSTTTKSMMDCKKAMIELLTNPSTAQHCVAVGECGLDVSEGFPPLMDQLPWFTVQTQVAQELNFPLFVHERGAYEDTMDVLSTITVPVLIHCFTGTKEQCQGYVDRGYSISISGYVLKESNGNCGEVRSCLQEGIIPLDRLMIETDAPYMGFTNSRQLYIEKHSTATTASEDGSTPPPPYVSTLPSKKRKQLQQSIYPNIPSSLPMVLQKVTECLQQHDSSITMEQVGMITTQNARTFFQF